MVQPSKLMCPKYGRGSTSSVEVLTACGALCYSTAILVRLICLLKLLLMCDVGVRRECFGGLRWTFVLHASRDHAFGVEIILLIEESCPTLSSQSTRCSTRNDSTSGILAGVKIPLSSEWVSCMTRKRDWTPQLCSILQRWLSEEVDSFASMSTGCAAPHIIGCCRRTTDPYMPKVGSSEID